MLLGVVLYGGIYGLSERQLRSHADPVLFSAVIPTDSLSIEVGRHIALTRGCHGCHGKELEGRDFTEDWPEVGRAVAPNLVKYLRDYGPAVMEAAIRQGIGHDGKALYSMPSYNFTNLTYPDLLSLMAYVQAHPVVEKELPSPKLNMTTRWALLRVNDENAVDLVKNLPDFIPFDERSSEARGQYIAMTTCIECHGLDLRGTAWGNPDLSIVAAYKKEEFDRLMKEGIGLVGSVCINVDVNYIQDVVAHDERIRKSFLDSICRTEMVLDENILSALEHDKAEHGKRHFRDF